MCSGIIRRQLLLCRNLRHSLLLSRWTWTHFLLLTTWDSGPLLLTSQSDVATTTLASLEAVDVEDHPFLIPGPLILYNSTNIILLRDLRLFW